MRLTKQLQGAVPFLLFAGGCDKAPLEPARTPPMVSSSVVSALPSASAPLAEDDVLETSAGKVTRLLVSPAAQAC